MSVFTGDETRVIRQHRFDTVCMLLAEHGECVELATDRVRQVTGRSLVHVTMSDLPRAMPASWLLAVIHCPEDRIDALAAWAVNIQLADQERIVFYEPESHPQLAAARALRPWAEAGLPQPVRQRVADHKELNRVLGNDLNWRILEDHKSVAKA